MIERILHTSVRFRWLVAFLTLVVVGFGAWQITKLPIDAVPDVTNRSARSTSRSRSRSPSRRRWPASLASK